MRRFLEVKQRSVTLINTNTLFYYTICVAFCLLDLVKGREKCVGRQALQARCVGLDGSSGKKKLMMDVIDIVCYSIVE